MAPCYTPVNQIAFVPGTLERYRLSSGREAIVVREPRGNLFAECIPGGDVTDGEHEELRALGALKPCKVSP
jgi:hypothetical protein